MIWRRNPLESKTRVTVCTVSDAAERHFVALLEYVDSNEYEYLTKRMRLLLYLHRNTPCLALIFFIVVMLDTFSVSQK